MPVNSLISAPAMKPLFLPEITITARGGSCVSGASTSSSSRSTRLERTLAEVPGLSIVSQTTESASRSTFQDETGGASLINQAQIRLMGSGRGTPCERVCGDVEVAHQ